MKNEMLEKKRELMMSVNRYERALIELNSWVPGDYLSEPTHEVTGDIFNIETRDKVMRMLRDLCKPLDKERNSIYGKFYLTEIIDKEKPEFTNNNLILAPTGSGKTHFMKSLINQEEVLLLVSTTSLKDNLAPKSEQAKERLDNRMYTSKNKSVYGEAPYKILVMTYAEFGERIKYEDNFANKYKQIFCDEIHSLLYYYTIGSSQSLLGVMKYLFAKKDDQEKYYFTATDEYLVKFKNNSGKMFQNVKVFNYLEHPNIVKHLVLSSYKINNLEQVRPHLKARKESFEYFNYKIFAFCKKVSSQLHLKKIMEEEGFTPLVLWSVNSEDHHMDEEQLKQREYVLRTGLIPDKYDALIINAAMQEGWDLLDPKVRLVVMNTVNKTEFVQSVGRVRKDVDVLVYKVHSADIEHYVNFPAKLIGVPLTTANKRDLCKELNITNKNGRLMMWPAIKLILQEQGLVINEKIVTIDKKTTRVSIVNHP